MPVDFAGFPCDYDELNELVKKHTSLFKPKTENQKKLGRVLILSDSAHSFGATYKSKKCGSLTDVSVFSFHAVKNLTTAEGGSVALNLPEPFDNEEVYKYLCMFTLHGQDKDALAKTQKGNWKYDIVEAGYKCNMTDLAAAIGLVELERYDNDTQVKRKHIFEAYNAGFKNDDRIQLPTHVTADKNGCYHLYPLRVKNFYQSCEETKRIIDKTNDLNLPYLGIDFHDRYFSNSHKTWKDWYMWLIEYLTTNHIEFVNFKTAVTALEH
jgi:dTDP-4-amino-4,6-dideoxygalactose transaminase